MDHLNKERGIQTVTTASFRTAKIDNDLSTHQKEDGYMAENCYVLA